MPGHVVIRRLVGPLSGGGGRTAGLVRLQGHSIENGQPVARGQVRRQTGQSGTLVVLSGGGAAAGGGAGRR